MSDSLFTSESVTEGHPDKIADQISDAILDALLAKDPFARVACETFVNTGLILVGGEITTTKYVDIPTIARDVINDIGYVHSDIGFDAKTCSVVTSIGQQSPDIAKGVDKEGAGDQGMMFGFACNETPELMPLPIMLAHKLVRQLTEARKTDLLPFLRPDGKSQVTVRYENDKPAEITTVVVSAQHQRDVTKINLEHEILSHVIQKVLPPELYDPETLVTHINPTGEFFHGGPKADAGLTGRKIIVDTYGGYARHGGGAFSGKDPTKVDRSGAYMARFAAKNVVAAGLAAKCSIQVAYAIGVAEPVSLLVDTFGTGKVEDKRIAEVLQSELDWRPSGIIQALDLRRPVYRSTATYGHFGRTEDSFTWERTDEIAPLLANRI